MDTVLTGRKHSMKTERRPHFLTLMSGVQIEDSEALEISLPSLMVNDYKKVHVVINQAF